MPLTVQRQDFAANHRYDLRRGPVQAMSRPAKSISDRCQSGRTGTIGNRVYWKQYRGFESLPVRHFQNQQITLRASLGKNEDKNMRDDVWWCSLVKHHYSGKSLIDLLEPTCCGLNKGVVQEIRMKIVGHADSDTTTGYTHAELASLRVAVDPVPSLAPAKSATSNSGKATLSQKTPRD